MTRATLIAVVLLAAAGMATATTTEQFDVRIPVTDSTVVAEVARTVPIDGVIDGAIRATLTPKQFADLQAAGLPFRLDKRLPLSALTMCPSGWEFATPPAWDCYPTWDQYVAYLEQLAAESPSIRVEEFGTTTNQVNPHRLLALVFEPTGTSEHPAPKVFLTSSMHGDETTGFALLLRLAWELAHRAGDHAQVFALRDRTEIWLNPLANPDGTYRGGDDTVAGAIRYYTTSSGASSGVDPNRNFPDPRYGDHPDGNPWWIETIHFMDLAERERFQLSANLHGGAELVNYPWDSTCDRHADDDWFLDLATAWASAAQEDGPPGLMDDCAMPRCSTDPCTPGVTNGADWYLVAGGRQDFVTGLHRGREITVELSQRKLEATESLQSHWQAQRRALLDFIGSVHRGVAGTVTDSSGMPLEATITIVGRDRPSDNSAAEASTGWFHRMLPAGHHDLLISAPGHAPMSVPGVPVGDSTTRLDIMLIRAPIAPLDRAPETH
jgi:hypothetical protein